MFRLLRTDNDNCRVYYEREGQLVCFQKGDPGSFGLFACTASGEPEYSLPHADVELDLDPAGDSATAVNFRAWRSATAWLQE